MESHTLDKVVEGIVTECYPVSDMMLFSLQSDQESYIYNKLGIVSKLLIEIQYPFSEVLPPEKSLDETSVSKDPTYQVQLSPVVIDLTLKEDELSSDDEESYIIHDYMLPINSGILKNYLDKLLGTRVIIKSENNVSEENYNA